MSFGGFPPRVRYTPVPNTVFGPLLEEIDDLPELKCTLRVIWLLNHKRGYPRLVTLDELQADRTLIHCMPDEGVAGHVEVERALTRAVHRGSLATGLLKGQARPQRVYVLNSEPHRRILQGVANLDVPQAAEATQEPEGDRELRPNVFALYEDNIGIISPMVAEDLREAEQLYPASWIEDAMREAVAQNRRSWRYIQRILERWEREGRSDGEPGRYPKQVGRQSERLRGRSASARRR